MMGDDIALQAEDPQLRTGAADRRVHEVQVRGRVGLLEPLTDAGAVGGALWVRGIRAPSQRGAEEHHRQGLPGARSPVEIAEAHLAGRRQGRQQERLERQQRQERGDGRWSRTPCMSGAGAHAPAGARLPDARSAG